MELTESQIRVLKCIAHRINSTGCQPSYREICKELGWSSPNWTKECLDKVCKAGLATRHGPRALEFDWRSYIK